jgi:hypothetical protein
MFVKMYAATESKVIAREFVESGTLIVGLAVASKVRWQLLVGDSRLSSLAYQALKICLQNHPKINLEKASCGKISF